MTYNNSLRKSQIRESLEWRYLEKRLRIYVAIGLLSWIGWMWMMINGIVFLAGQKIVIFN